MGCVRIMQTYGVSGIKLKSASSCPPHTLTPPSSLPCSHLFPPSSVFTSATRSLSPNPLPPLYLAHSFNLSPPPPPPPLISLTSLIHSLFPHPLPSSLISLTHFTHLLSHAPPSSLLISLTHSFTLSYPSPAISRSLLPPLSPAELERSSPPPSSYLAHLFTLPRASFISVSLTYSLNPLLSLPIHLSISLTHPHPQYCSLLQSPPTPIPLCISPPPPPPPFLHSHSEHRFPALSSKGRMS